MSESQNSEINPESQKSSRRDFFKKAGKITFGLSGLALAISEAQRISENKIETPNATFYPFYEMHGEGVDLSSAQLPPNLDLHWVEGIYLDFVDEPITKKTQLSNQVSTQSITNNNTEIDLGPDKGFIKYYAGRSNKKDNNFEKTLDYLRENNIPMANGDILYIKRENVATDNVKSMVRGAIFDAAIVYFAAKYGIKDVNSFKKRILSQINEQKQKPQGILRRKFLEMSGIAATAAVGGSTLMVLGELASQPNSSSEIKVASRAFDRIVGLLGYLQPYDQSSFLRNVVWADKLLDFAEKRSQVLGRKVNISYQVGLAGHSGLEDFLILGRDFCQTILNAYPKSELEEVVHINNGAENMAKTRIFEVLPKESDNSADQHVWEIVDKQLQTLLENKVQPIKKSPDLFARKQ